MRSNIYASISILSIIIQGHSDDNIGLFILSVSIIKAVDHSLINVKDQHLFVLRILWWWQIDLLFSL